MKVKQRAFTLVEMIVVLFIISLLILLILPNLTGQRKHADTVSRDALVNVVQTQADLYADDHGQPATNLDQLVSEHYLTPAQEKRAQSVHLKLVEGRVER